MPTVPGSSCTDSQSVVGAYEEVLDATLQGGAEKACYRVYMILELDLKTANGN